MKNASRGYSTEMSPEAIARRFEILQQMNELCEWLGSAKPLGAVEAGGAKEMARSQSVGDS